MSLGFKITTLLAFVSLFGVINSLTIDDLCPSGYTYIANKCYKFHQTKANWQTAFDTCERENTHLANVLNNQEYSGLLSHMNSNSALAGQYWISGARVNNKWIWTGHGSHMNRQWWGKTPRSSSNCSYFCSLTNKYWGAQCSIGKRFVCEMRMDCSFPSPDSEIDLGGFDKLTQR